MKPGASVVWSFIVLYFPGNLSLRSGCSTEPPLVQPPLQHKALMELTKVRQNTRDLKRS
jgi:hypothetical protein